MDRTDELSNNSPLFSKSDVENSDKLHLIYQIDYTCLYSEYADVVCSTLVKISELLDNYITFRFFDDYVIFQILKISVGVSDAVTSQCLEIIYYLCAVEDKECSELLQKYQFLNILINIISKTRDINNLIKALECYHIAIYEKPLVCYKIDGVYIYKSCLFVFEMIETGCFHDLDEYYHLLQANFILLSDGFSFFSITRSNAIKLVDYVNMYLFSDDIKEMFSVTRFLLTVSYYQKLSCNYLFINYDIINRLISLLSLSCIQDNIIRILDNICANSNDTCSFLLSETNFFGFKLDEKMKHNHKVLRGLFKLYYNIFTFINDMANECIRCLYEHLPVILDNLFVFNLCDDYKTKQLSISSLNKLILVNDDFVLNKIISYEPRLLEIILEGLNSVDKREKISVVKSFIILLNYSHRTNSDIFSLLDKTLLESTILEILQDSDILEHPFLVNGTQEDISNYLNSCLLHISKNVV